MLPGICLEIAFYHPCFLAWKVRTLVVCSLRCTKCDIMEPEQGKTWTLQECAWGISEVVLNPTLSAEQVPAGQGRTLLAKQKSLSQGFP